MNWWQRLKWKIIFRRKVRKVARRAAIKATLDQVIEGNISLTEVQEQVFNDFVREYKAFSEDNDQA